ncbi:5,10-methylenetetrahydrofolate reductase [bacterium]|jgi:5,10-methylenetetrahydrofolate reductase|nr:5,10-methylenetetrahydrofolate reductase [bacterium]
MNFHRQIEERQFTITVEIDPPKGPGFKKFLSRLEPLIPLVDALNIAHCPVAQLRMDPLAFAQVLRREFDVEVILHLTMRDLSLLGLQSYLLGASALGYHNILAMTGDSAKHSDVEGTRGVFQGNSLELIKIVRKLNAAQSSSGRRLNKKTAFLVGATCNPSAMNLTNEVKRIHKKFDAGARFFQTQPLFLKKNIEVFYEYANGLPAPVLMGSMLLKSYDSALWLNAKVPGLFVPAEVLERLKTRNTQEEAIQISLDFWHSSHQHLDGIHLFPMNNYEALGELLTEIRSIRSRHSDTP